MKLYFAYNNEGMVYWWAEGKNELKKTHLKEIAINVTKNDYNKLLLNYNARIVNGKLILEKSLVSIDKEKIKKEINSSSDLDDIKGLLKELLNNI